MDRYAGVIGSVNDPVVGYPNNALAISFPLNASARFGSACVHSFVNPNDPPAGPKFKFVVRKSRNSTPNFITCVAITFPPDAASV